MINVNEVVTKSIITKSNLPDADYVINPYIGCPHKCIYCYAEFMKRFTNHKEPWGDFIDIKNSLKNIDVGKLSEKVVLLSSVTDAYNIFEKKYCVTQKILEQFIDSNANLEILTKSNLILRDLPILIKIKNLKVGISLNTLDDNLRSMTEPRASSIEQRIDTLKKLKDNGIKTYAFISPIFPEITNIFDIIDRLEYFVDEFYFENLNLRGNYKKRFLDFIMENFTNLYDLYRDIYNNNNDSYWDDMNLSIQEYCKKKNIKYKIYFNHSNKSKT